MAVKCDNCPLRELEIFVPFTTEEARFMKGFKIGELTVDAQTPLLIEGSNAPQLYTVLAGQGVRFKTLEDGRRQVVNFVFPGDFIGLQAGVMGEMGHSITSATEMTLCVFDRAEIWSLFKSHPDRAFDLTWLAASEEMFLGESLATIGQRSALEAVAWTLQRLFQRGEALGLTTANEMPLPFRQQDLADALGLSLVHTNKTLAKLKDRGMVLWQDGVLGILDRTGLSDVAGIPMEALRPRPLI
ncbi:Crp/Fnr family transcriptional regulator [Jannaschia donghaensis]|uniref:Nitrogen fixation regulation protein FixK n=1 Tax=Jannaschia donghaensis TaxID=420998 RepID=A0A0M6YEF9_9RHOB|nr:Crp/Fnr family transcriptional regulator [Jannaschia donghaensis]CTQ48085.1 Nitrogen fixation regulation protein FixK [Jannaschia donghaensis]